MSPRFDERASIDPPVLFSIDAVHARPHPTAGGGSGLGARHGDRRRRRALGPDVHPGERVTVRARLRSGGSVHALVDQFVVAQQDPITSTRKAIHPGRPSEVQSFRSRPEPHPPVVRVTAQSPAVAPGNEFLAPDSGTGQAGPVILDQSGGLVWFDPLAQRL